MIDAYFLSEQDKLPIRKRRHIQIRRMLRKAQVYSYEKTRMKKLQLVAEKIFRMKIDSLIKLLGKISLLISPKPKKKLAVALYYLNKQGLFG